MDCGRLSADDAGKQVVLNGWVARRRDHGGLIFIDLRDRSGMVQVVFTPNRTAQVFATAESLRIEYVVAVWGKVRVRPDGTENPEMETGTVEVVADGLLVLSEAKTPPIYISDKTAANVDEVVRLRYRYLDLRRAEMQGQLITGTAWPRLCATSSTSTVSWR